MSGCEDRVSGQDGASTTGWMAILGPGAGMGEADWGSSFETINQAMGKFTEIKQIIRVNGWEIPK